MFRTAHARTLAFLLLSLVFSLSSCDSIKRFLSSDLEEGSIEVGELYRDEYVADVPYTPSASPEAHEAGRVNAIGLERSNGDNEELYDAISEWIGTPYLYGGTTKKGVDCSAFVGHIYKKVYNIQLHRVADDIRKDVTIITRTELREGDIVFFTNSKGKVSHVGIYLKDGLFAHASTSRGVIVSRLDDAYWSKHFYKGGHVPEVKN